MRIACFQRSINKIIQDEELEITYPYLNDVIICVKDSDGYDRNIKRFLAVAKKYNLTKKKKKCKFYTKPVNLLGHIIQNKKIKRELVMLAPLMKLPVSDILTTQQSS